MSTPASTTSPYTRKNPFPAKLLTNRLLSGEGSGKEMRHYEICLKGSGLTYEVGDALGVYPSNDPALVEEIIHALHATGEEEVPAAEGGGKKTTLRTALLQQYQITQTAKPLLEAIARRVEGESVVKELMEDPLRREDLAKYTYGMEVIDFLLTHPSIHFTPAEFVPLLRKLQPRLYSISSSLKAHPEEVHLTIATVRYESHGRQRKGVCSTFLSDRAEDPARVPLFFHQAKHFRLPEDTNLPVIMVGPGTGIAPFRAYLEERQIVGAKGKNWLFFGDQKASTDYVYREELEAFQANGTLTRLSLAFSRDQAEKIYVQHRMMEEGAELYKWLEEGAHFFVCGDASRMAKDVDAALHKVIEHHGGKNPEEAASYVETLKKSKRYKRDVY
jgi:sulfite reductase (NADPH) flavoprotein alpha-component